MTLANCPAPTTAERIRSTCVRAGGALLAVDGGEPLTTPLHHLLGDGSFAVTVPVDGAVAAHVFDCGAGGAQAVLELADYAPLPLREPVRSLVWIRGRLHQVPLPTVPGVLDGIAAEHPNPALLQVQTPESGPVADDDTRLPARLRRGDVRPLGVDRYGVRLRVESADGDRDVRLPFRQPVDDVTGLGQAIRVSMGCPFVNGLRTRRD